MVDGRGSNFDMNAERLIDIDSWSSGKDQFPSSHRAGEEKKNAAVFFWGGGVSKTTDVLSGSDPSHIFSPGWR